MKYFSTFSGIGGFELGIGNRGECIGYSEIDKYAIKCYEQHFPSHKNYGNIREINPDDIPDFDLFCGGFPCQSFSIAGKRKGFQDTRGTLFHEIIRICKSKRPRLLLLENVKGLLSADNGWCFATIISSLDELGYDVEWEVLNSKDFGVPQNRERVFIVGHLRGTGGRQVFPLGRDCKEDVDESKEEQGRESRVETLDSRYGQRRSTETYVRPVLTPDRLEKQQNGRRIKEDGEPMFTLTGTDIHGVQIQQLNEGTHQKYRLYGESGLSPSLNAVGFTPKIQNHFPRSSTTGKGGTGLLESETTCFALDTSPHYVDRIRRLTPAECERLQGFPDGWTSMLSDTQRYKTLGNAVTVNVIGAIMEKMCEVKE